ncbi:MAG: zinc ribbon domain-containing protein [Candidatus Bathyarchaeia archaeon]|jgi:hypothetical protein
MNRLIKGFRKAGWLAKACLGLPYVPMGILMMLAFSWFNQPPDLMLTATLMFAFPVSWLCRLQCEREQSFYKKLYRDSKRYLQTTSQTKPAAAAAKNCPSCNKPASPENNFCPYCATNLRGQNIQGQVTPQKQG